MEIALNYFFVAVTELGGRARDEGGVEVRVLLEVSFSSSVEEPGRAAPGRGDAFAYVALCFRGAGWKLGGEVGRELRLSHIGMPFSGSSLLDWRVAAAPGVMLATADIVASFQKAVLITCRGRRQYRQSSG